MEVSKITIDPAKANGVRLSVHCDEGIAMTVSSSGVIHKSKEDLLHVARVDRDECCGGKIFLVIFQSGRARLCRSSLHKVEFDVSGQCNDRMLSEEQIWKALALETGIVVPPDLNKVPKFRRVKVILVSPMRCWYCYHYKFPSHQDIAIGTRVNKDFMDIEFDPELHKGRVISLPLFYGWTSADDFEEHSLQKKPSKKSMSVPKISNSVYSHVMELEARSVELEKNEAMQLDVEPEKSKFEVVVESVTRAMSSMSGIEALPDEDMEDSQANRSDDLFVDQEAGDACGQEWDLEEPLVLTPLDPAVEKYCQDMCARKNEVQCHRREAELLAKQMETSPKFKFTGIRRLGPAP